MRRAVLYARVSGDDRQNEGRNLAGQLEDCRKYAAEHGYKVVAELAEDDRGASGAEIDLPQLNRILEMAKAKEIDLLIVREIDRLSRSLGKQLYLEEELQRHKVTIEYVLGQYADNPEGKLQKHVKAMIADYERSKIGERVTRGRRLKVKDGSVMPHGHRTYGYRVIQKPIHSDKPKGSWLWALEKDPIEGPIVQDIFAWYANGDQDGEPMSLREIARRLTALGIPTLGDEPNSAYKKKRPPNQWTGPHVSKMLHNETYAGTWHYGKETRSKEDWIPVTVPALVDRATWQAVQDRLAHNAKHRRKHSQYEYLLTGRLTCAECKKHMHGTNVTSPRYSKTWSYYRCWAANSGSKPSTPCSLRGYYRVDLADGAVWNWVKSFLLDPEALAQGLDQFRNEQAQKDAPTRRRLATIDDMLADVRRQQSRLLGAFVRGVWEEEAVMTMKAELDTKIAALEKERKPLAAGLLKSAATEAQLMDLQRFAADVGKRLPKADQDFSKRRQLIEMLDVQCTLGVEDGQQVLYASCALRMEPDRLSLLSPNDFIGAQPANDFVLTRRFVLGKAPRQPATTNGSARA